MSPLLIAGLLIAELLNAGPAWSGQIGLAPANSAVEFRTYGFGFLPLDGKFTRFHGWIRYDAGNPRACVVMLDIEAGSLSMSSAAIRDRITGPGMVNVAVFPYLTFRGSCQNSTIVGDLTMHGETHMVTFDYTRAAGTITATGRLRRAKWGITGNSLLGGSTVRLRVVVPDPAAASHT